jgi:vacuolar-type H+-ATPase subunit F/Vma7
MPDVLFIGDEVTASGFRLAGWPVAITSRDVATVFEAACDSAWLVVLTVRAARQLSGERLDAVYAQGRPLLLVLPDAIGGPVPADIAEQLRTLIGHGT